jgi:LmbE family N-acetylglucosaminyl deacetylase
MNILAFGAHDDDWDEYCGGTLKRYAQAGHQIGVVSLTTGRNYGAARSSSELGEIRKKEFESATSFIGECKTYWPGSAYNRLENNFEILKIVAGIIYEFQPDIIFTHPPDDYHPDHIAATQLVIEASHSASYLTAGPRLFFPGASLPAKPLFSNYPVIYFYDAEDGHGFLPEDYVDITSVWETKRQMMNSHRSQIEAEMNGQWDGGDNPFLTTIEIIGRYRGMQCGVTYAEAFRLYRVAGRVYPGRLLP